MSQKCDCVACAANRLLGEEIVLAGHENGLTPFAFLAAPITHAAPPTLWVVPGNDDEKVLVALKEVAAVLEARIKLRKALGVG